MTDARVVRIERLDMAFAPRPWPFAQSRRAEIDAHFARRKAERPQLFNGQVLVLYEHAVEGAVFRSAHLKIMQEREDAAALRARIMEFLARQDPPELSDILIVRSLADLDPRMLPFVVGFLREQWPAGSDP